MIKAKSESIIRVISGNKEKSAVDCDPLALDRWNVERKREVWDADIRKFRNQSLDNAKNIRIHSNKEAAKLYEKIFYVMRWSNPPLPMSQQELILRYCDHYIGPQPEKPFQEENLFNMWTDKQIGTVSEKTNNEISVLCKKLKSVVLQRNVNINTAVREFHKGAEKLTMKKDADLRWTMERNRGKKDKYWTVWYLASKNLLAELERMLLIQQKQMKLGKLESDSQITNETTGAIHENMPFQLFAVNDRDPDFGLTALHYACKGSYLDVIKWLLEHGADDKARGPDGRTPLHYAAQYASRDIVLELLGQGADYFAVDDYGCTPLDLAIQNKNTKTMGCLEQWTKLIPPEEKAAEAAPEDLTFIPEEYHNVDDAVINAMSPVLQLLTRRMHGTTTYDTSERASKTHSFHNKMDRKVELRLCQKHAALCFVEKFVEEGVKSLRRRWYVCKTYITEHKKKFPVSFNFNNQNGYVESRSDTSDVECDVNPVVACEAALEVIDKLVSLKRDGQAATILAEATSILITPLCIIPIVSAIALLARRCEILICTHDVLVSEKGVISERTQRKLRKSNQSPLPVLTEMSESSSFSVQNSVVSEDVSHGALEWICQESISVESSVVASCNSEDIVKSKVLPILNEAQQAIEQGIHLHHALHAEDVIEPCTLAPLLELLANVFERKENDFEALKIMRYACTVTSRALGHSSSENIRYMLEMLRLQIRVCKSKSDYEGAAQLAVEISRYLDILAASDPEKAVTQTKKCVELLSLARLLEHGDIKLPMSFSGYSRKI